MFSALSKNLTNVLDKLTKKGIVTEKDIDETLKDVRISLLEADVSLDVVKEFVGNIKVKATGKSVVKSVTPGQQIIKIVYDELVDLLSCNSKEDEKLKISSPPAGILMIGLQGSGKTTTTAKLAQYLKSKDNKKVIMASLDTRRPAAMDQLKILGEQNKIDVLEIVPGENPSAIAARAALQASLGGYDVFILDTAGRMNVDIELMEELRSIKRDIKPNETLLVVDGLTGQDALNVAKDFDSSCGLDGLVVTKLDGDSRGGAALSMRAVTKKPIKFIGLGEKSSDLEMFDATRIAKRILGMGDIVSLVEKAQEQMDEEKTNRMIRRLEKGHFNMNDLRLQLEQTVKMGGVKGMMGMIPGLGKFSKQVNDAALSDKVLKKQIALIYSMTRKERANPQILQASRKIRIAHGSGQEVSDLNKLIKMHKQMSGMMKKISKKGNRGMLKSLIADLTGIGANKVDSLDPRSTLVNPSGGLGSKFGQKDLRGLKNALPGLLRKN